MSGNKNYGLLISKKGLQKTNLLKVPSIFETESSDDEFQNAAKKAVNKDINDESSKKLSMKQTQIEMKKALAEDPTVYEYDDIYDEMEEKKKEETNTKHVGVEKKSKYISKLIKSTEMRKVEDERRKERKIHKERENEGGEFAEREEFVTSAYRQKMVERAEEDERIRKQNAQDAANDVTKQKDLSMFYKNFSKNVAMGGTKEPMKETKIQTEKRPHSSSEDERQKRKTSSKNRSYRRKHYSESESSVSESDVKEKKKKKNDSDSDDEVTKIKTMEEGRKKHKTKVSKRSEEELDSQDELEMKEELRMLKKKRKEGEKKRLVKRKAKETSDEFSDKENVIKATKNKRKLYSSEDDERSKVYRRKNSSSIKRKEKSESSEESDVPVKKNKQRSKDVYKRKDTVSSDEDYKHKRSLKEKQRNPDKKSTKQRNNDRSDDNSEEELREKTKKQKIKRKRSTSTSVEKELDKKKSSSKSQSKKKNIFAQRNTLDTIRAARERYLARKESLNAESKIIRDSD